MNKIEKIARRIFLAFSSRAKIWQYGFSKQSETGVAIFKYNFFPYLWAYPTKDGKVTVVYMKDQKKVCYGFFSYSLSNKYIDYLRNRMKGYAQTDRNFRILLSNEITQNGISSDFDFLIGKQETISIDQAKQLLTHQCNLSLNNFEKVFGSQGDSKIFSYGGFDYCFNGSEFTEQEIKQRTDELISSLPNAMKSLCYGRVELKKEFNKNTAGDYNFCDDTIRMGGSKNDFIEIIIHQLAHRWQHRIASSNQIKQFNELYDNCNGKNLKFNQGDIITFHESKNEYIYVCMGISSLMMRRKSDNEMLYFNKKAKRSFETVNGNKIQKYYFPSNYSQKKLTEFISECIAYCYANLPMDENLKKEVKRILGD